MPFTFSHPTLILPLLKWKKKLFPVTGLVIGSITPDFEYFIKFRKGYSSFSHTLPSILYFNFPLAVVIAFLFHQVVKKPMIMNLPKQCCGRFIGYYHLKWRSYFLKSWPFYLLSAVLGTLKHLFWDWLTHANANYLFQIKYLFIEKASEHHNIIYVFLHFIYSLIGLFALLHIFYKLSMGSEDGGEESRYKYWESISI